MKNKLVETENNVCDRTVRNRQNEIGFTFRKAKKKKKNSSDSQTEKITEKPWHVEHWIQVM